MGVPQYTTPTFTLKFTEKDLDLTQAESVFVTFRSGMNKLTKTGESLTVEEKQITVTLSQVETARMSDSVDIQANWVIAGNRIASNIAKVEIGEQLLNEVIT